MVTKKQSPLHKQKGRKGTHVTKAPSVSVAAARKDVELYWVSFRVITIMHIYLISFPRIIFIARPAYDTTVSTKDTKMTQRSMQIFCTELKHQRTQAVS